MKDLFTIDNRVAIHESGHAVVGWVMKVNCDTQAFEWISSIFHYWDSGSFRGACHFEPNRATNINPSAAKTRNLHQAVADLAINMAGCSTYRAYLDILGDPDYFLHEINLFHSEIVGNRLEGFNHDFRYFSDIARFDLGIDISKIEEFAKDFQNSLVLLLKVDHVQDGVVKVAQGLLDLQPGAFCLDSSKIKILEDSILPTLQSKKVANLTQELLQVCRNYAKNLNEL